MREHLKRYLDKGMKTHVRGLRILLEYFHATEKFDPVKRTKTLIVSVFGSARIKAGTPEYRRAYQLGKRLYQAGFAVVTGASRGTMQAANQGVANAIADEIVQKKKAANRKAATQTQLYQKLLKKHSLGLLIALPFEEEWNPYVGRGTTFHYFMIRKFFFASLSHAFVACEGGWGTRDELFEMLTLVQTGKASLMPIVYLSPDPQHLRQDLKHAVDAGYIDKKDLKLIDIARTPDQAVKVITRFYHRVRHISVKKSSVRIWLHRQPSQKLKQRLDRDLKRIKPPLSNYRWSRNSFFIPNFKHPSYGTIRDIVDLINR